ncbi:MAG: carbohydrate ABC transporter permease [Bacteroidetes bacterium]|nr:carbohydrate ABC transporter permease [Bacteroidota bacterium]
MVQSNKQRVGTTILIILMTALSIIVLFPFYWMLISSFKEIGRIFSTPIDFIPKPFTLAGYQRLITETLYGRWYLNSLIITVLYTTLAIFFSTLGGFAFAKYSFKYKNILFIIVLSSMMIPLHGILIPLFLVLVKLGWIDTFQGVIIPFAASPFGIFFVRQYSSSIPDELLYAGRIDGCSEISLYTKIMLPLLKPAIGVLTIYFSMICWNWFVWPLVVIRNSLNFPLNVGLATFITQYEIRYDEVMAGAVLCTLPLVVIFVTMQKQFVTGLTAGAVKQ